MPSVSAPLKSILFLEMKEIALEAKQVAFKNKFCVSAAEVERKRVETFEKKILKTPIG